MRSKPLYLEELAPADIPAKEREQVNLGQIPSPILLHGNEHMAYRDPCAVYHEGVIRLYYTLVETEADGQVYMYTAMSASSDLCRWSKPLILTPRDQRLNYSSPGSIVRFRDRWVMCLQSYPRPNGEKYGNDSCRIWTMESKDLVHWTSPRLLRVKGEDIPAEDMGRMIDPYLMESREEPGQWYCFYKQNGVSLSKSRDLEHWTSCGSEQAGENVCILHDDQEYVMFHSPDNGIGVMRSSDLRAWTRDDRLITLGQPEWDWARGRITAAFTLDLRAVPGVEAFVMFFHGTGPEDEQIIFDTHACIGIAWSHDLKDWHWPK